MTSTVQHSRSTQARSLQSAHLAYRPDIDGLRAVAVLSVVAFHAAPNFLTGGFVGVDVFFVISGYLISRIIFESLERGAFSFREFYCRRINRIFPALLFVLLATYAIGWFTLLADEFKMLGKHTAAGAGFASNIVLLTEAGYFDASADTKPLLHLWSLGIEEQFYLMWPVALLLAWKRKYGLLALTVIAAVVSFYLNIRGVKSVPVETFFLPHTRFWELLCGGLLAWMTLYGGTGRSAFVQNVREKLEPMRQWANRKVGHNGLANAASILGACLLAYGFWRIHPELKFPGRWALVPVLGAVLLIAAGPGAWVNSKVLSNRSVIWFGLISFPLYLWHWPLLTFLRIVQGDVPNAPLRLAAVLLSIVLAWLTYRLIERPVRSSQHRRGQTVVLVCIAVVTGGVGYATYANDGLKQRSMALQSKDFDYTDEVAGYRPCDFPEFKGKESSLNYCLVPTRLPPDSALIGDSHAEDKFRGIVAVDKKRTWMLMGNSSCPPTLGVTIEGDQKNCETKFNAIFEHLAQKKNIKHVVLSFYGHYFATSAYAADHVKSNFGPQKFKLEAANRPDLLRAEVFYAGIDAAVKFLIANGKTVTLLVDIPELPFLPRDCFRNALNECNVPRDEALSRQADLRRIIGRLQESNPALITFDPIALMCEGNWCKYVKDGIVLYRDSHHLSPRGSVEYAQKFIGAQ